MMHKLVSAILLAAGVTLTGLGAQAQTKAPATAAAQAKPATDPSVQLFKSWDKNADGQLSQQEFSTGWHQAQAALQLQARLRRQFGTIDGNRDGALDVAEYGNLVLIKNAGKSAPPLARFDSNGNGKLEFNEYVKLVETLAPNEPAGKGGKP
jgi:Ca2+-binding EF-hand superfamily protein